MGQEKRNPNHIAKKAGLLPEKPKKPSKREQEALLKAAVLAKLLEVMGRGKS
jgi:hypothetical protein